MYRGALCPLDVLPAPIIRGDPLEHLARVCRDLELSRDLLTAALADQAMLDAAGRAVEIVSDALLAGRKLLLAGNGGSAADAQHLATELVVRFKKTRDALPAIALTTDSSILTAIGNDLGFEQLFARQILALGQPGDVLLAISTSGRSPNILAACRAARARGMPVIGFTGAQGEPMRQCCDVSVHVPSDDTALIQQVHITLGHTLCAIVEDAIAKPAPPLISIRRAARAEQRMTLSLIPVLMCGGSGTRLWPVSRESMPKQFVPLIGDRSTFQQTLARIADPAMFARPIVITNTDFRFIVAEQLRELGVEADIVLEPSRRDSGPAVAVAAALAARRDPESCVLVLASDHVVRNPEQFIVACREAAVAAAQGRIVTFGVRPTATGDKLRLYPAGREAKRRGGACGRGLRREAGCRDGGPLRRRELSLEQRQLHVPRRRHDRGDRALRAGDRGGRARGGRRA